MTQFVCSVGFRGANGKVVKREFTTIDHSTGTVEGDFSATSVDLAALVTAIEAITDAEVAYAKITYSDPNAESGSLGTGDVFENAFVSAHINATGEAEKLATLQLPAPAIGIFTGSTGSARDIVDPADTDLQAFISELSTNFLVSDGEAINTAEGTAGIKGGRRNARSYKL